MSSKGKKLLITTRKHEIFIVHAARNTAIYEYCPTCKAEVEMLTLDKAVRISDFSGREVIRRMAENEIHSIETASGDLLVCRECLNGGLSPGR